MACNCNIIKATSVELTTPTTGEPFYTITVPATVDLADEGPLNIGLFTSIPSGASCCYVQVTNGTSTLDILRCNGNYWRPCQLKCRSVLHLQVLTDPEHLLIKA